MKVKKAFSNPGGTGSFAKGFVFVKYSWKLLRVPSKYRTLGISSLLNCQGNQDVSRYDTSDP